MSASSVNWVCFPCRNALRQDRYLRKTPACPRCGDPCLYLGDRVEVPRATAVKAWAKLEEEWHARRLASIEEYLSGDWHSRPVLESLIDELASLPENGDTADTIAKLRNRLRKVAKREGAERESRHESRRSDG